MKKIFINALQKPIWNHLPISFQDCIFQCPILRRACPWQTECLRCVQDFYAMFRSWQFLPVSQWVPKCVDVWLSHLQNYFLRFWWLYCLIPWLFLLWLSRWRSHLHFWMHCLFVFALIQDLMFHWDWWESL